MYGHVRRLRASSLSLHWWTNVHERFREDRTSGKWSKSPDRRTDGHVDGHGVIVYLRRVADKKCISMFDLEGKYSLNVLQGV